MSAWKYSSGRCAVVSPRLTALFACLAMLHGVNCRAMNKEPAIFHILEDRDELVLRLDDAEWKDRDIPCDVMPCLDPQCDCARIALICRVAEAGQEQQVKIVIDADGWKLEGVSGDHPRAEALGKALMSAMTDGDKAILWTIFIRLRQHLLHAVDPNKIHFTLSKEDVSKGVRPFAYSEVFGIGSELAAETPGVMWTVEDFYIADPDVKGSNVLLAFWSGDMITESGEEVEPDCTLAYDYRGGKIEVIGNAGSGLKSGPDELIRSLKDAYEDLDDLLELRHMQMRIIFANALAEMDRGETVAYDEPKTGRNDPCPCGSGRKYKKCCGSPDKELPW